LPLFFESDNQLSPSELRHHTDVATGFLSNLFNRLVAGTMDRSGMAFDLRPFVDSGIDGPVQQTLVTKEGTSD